MMQRDLTQQIDYKQHSFQSKVILEREKQKAILFAFWEVQQLKEHIASCDVLLIMLEGVCDLKVEEEWQRETGQVVLIPAHAPHALKAETNFKFVLVK